MSTPNMGLTLPTVSSTTGPEYAQQINDSIETVDAHDHTSGKGAPVPTGGININAALPMNGYDVSDARTVQLRDQETPPDGAADLSAIYSSGGDMFFRNGAGTAVKITDGASLSSASFGGISGLGGTTGSAAYNGGTGTFSFRKASNEAASMDVGPVVIRDSAASAHGITVKSPAGVAAPIDFTLPGTLPASSTKLLGVGTTGGMSYLDADASTLENTGTQLRVKDLGVTTAKLNDLAVTEAKIAAGAVTAAKVASGSKNVANGIASLDADAKLPLAQTHSAITSVKTVPTELMPETMATSDADWHAAATAYAQVTGVQVGDLLIVDFSSDAVVASGTGNASTFGLAVGLDAGGVLTRYDVATWNRATGYVTSYEFGPVSAHFVITAASTGTHKVGVQVRRSSGVATTWTIPVTTSIRVIHVRP